MQIISYLDLIMEYSRPSMREEYDTSASRSIDTDYPIRSLEKSIGQSTQPYTFIIS